MRRLGSGAYLVVVGVYLLVVLSLELLGLGHEGGLLLHFSKAAMSEQYYVSS